MLQQRLWPLHGRSCGLGLWTIEGFEPEVPVEKDIVSLEKSMGLEVDNRDVNELVKEHSQTTEEFKEQYT